MVKYLHKKCTQAKWLEPAVDEYGEIESSTANLGVVLRRADKVYTTEPMSINSQVVMAAERLGAAVAFTMSSDIVHGLIQTLGPFQRDVQVDRGITLPIVNSIQELVEDSSIPREAYMCLCKEERFVLLWGDNVQGILAHGADIETRFLSLVSKLLRVLDSERLIGTGLGFQHSRPYDDTGAV